MRALGLIEVIGYPAAIEAADSALKAANIKLGGITKVGSGIMTVQIFGDVGAVKASVDAAGSSASKIGQLRATHVIPSVDESLVGTVIKDIPSEKSASVKRTTDDSTSVDSSKQDSSPAGFSNSQTDGTTREDNLDAPKGVDKEQSIVVEDLKKKGVMELRRLIEHLGIEVEEQVLKNAKKESLIQIVLDYLDKKGEA